jgi:DNA-binding transcriptional regulator YiaG
MNKTEFREARRKLGFSQKQLATLLKVASDRTVRRWEAGEKDIPGPVIVLMNWLLSNKKPKL